MKKLLALGIVFFILVTAYSQRTSFGIKAGINSSSVEIDNGSDYDSKIGFHAGGLAHIHISDHFAVQPEVLFSMQGGESGDAKLKLNYLNVPVLAQYMFGEGFRLQTGPQIGFLLGAESKVGDVEVDVEDVFNSIDFSWSFGAGYLFPQGIGLDLRYNLGLSNISDDNNFEAKNRVLQFGLFYQFKRNN